MTHAKTNKAVFGGNYLFRANRLIALILLSLLSCLCSVASANDICSCSPSFYEFQLDFSLFCPPSNILDAGIVATSCLVSPFGNPNVDDLVPVAVQSIDILELGQDLRVFAQETISGNFGDGDIFSYTSIAALENEISDPNDNIRAIQLNLVGINASDEPIINVFIITFTNECDVIPFLGVVDEESIGWTVFNKQNFSFPRTELCPIAPSQPPTISPTVEATQSPTKSPVVEPTQQPTRRPVVESTPQPTRRPVVEPPSTFSMSYRYDNDFKFNDEEEDIWWKLYTDGSSYSMEYIDESSSKDHLRLHTRRRRNAAQVSR